MRTRRVPAQTAAALRFSGRWSRGSYEKRAAQLLAALEAAGLEVVGAPRYARFDPPWTPWFLRRNEVVVPPREIRSGVRISIVEDPDGNWVEFLAAM